MVQRRYHTRDRVPFLVRTATPEDVKQVLCLQREAMAESSEFFVRTHEEFDRDKEVVAKQLIGLLSRDNSEWMVAEMEGNIIGSLDFHGGEYARIRHVGHFGMTVRQEYRNQGVGSALVETMLLWARENPAIEKVTTNLFTNNARAIALYTRFGFQAEGRRHREYLVSPRRYLDALMLAKWIK